MAYIGRYNSSNIVDLKSPVSVDGVPIIGSGGTIENATLATSNTFPAGQPLNFAHTVINSSLFNYASTGAQVNCTNIAVSINKTKTSSKLILQYSIPFRVYWGPSQYFMDGDVWWKRTAPSTLDNQYPQHVYYADELAANAAFHFYRLVTGYMIDDNAATGTHTYVFQIDANSTTTGGYFGTWCDTTSTGLLLLTEIS